MATKKELRNKLSQMEDLYYEIIRDKIEMIKERLEDQEQIETIRDKIEMIKERLEDQEQIIDLKKKIEKLEKENKELKER